MVPSKSYKNHASRLPLFSRGPSSFGVVIILAAIDLILFIFYVLFSLGHLQGRAKVHVPHVRQVQRSPSPSCGERSRVLARPALIFTLPQKGREEGKDPPRIPFAVSDLSAASTLSFFLWAGSVVHHHHQHSLAIDTFLRG